MSQQELLKKVIQTLDDSGIQYLVTGSVASSLLIHGVVGAYKDNQEWFARK